MVTYFKMITYIVVHNKFWRKNFYGYVRQDRVDGLKMVKSGMGGGEALAVRLSSDWRADPECLWKRGINWTRASHLVRLNQPTDQVYCQRRNISRFHYLVSLTRRYWSTQNCARCLLKKTDLGATRCTEEIIIAKLDPGQKIKKKHAF